MRRLLCLTIIFSVLLHLFAAPAYANRRGIEYTAEELKLGDKAVCYIGDGGGEDDSQDYKIVLTGNHNAFSIRFTARAYKTYFYVCDSNGNKIRPFEIYTESGRRVSGSINSTSAVGFQWNSTMKRSSGTITYRNLRSGTYYIRVFGDDDDYDYDDYRSYGEVTLTISRAANTSGSSESGSDEKAASDVTVSIHVSLKPGQNVQLGASTENSGGRTPEWKSSNERVATVSRKGVVKGLWPGFTTITVSVGGKSKSIHVVVTE